MVDTITITRDGFVTGRLTAPAPTDQNVYVSYSADFTGPASIAIDFTVVNQAGTFGIPKMIFIDNSSGNNNIEVNVEGTNQYFEAPAYSMGYYPIDCKNNSARIQLDTIGGAVDPVTITVYNWERAPVVWYVYGANNKDIPDKMQGAYPNGTTAIDGRPYPNPVYVAGRGPSGELVALKTDASGRLDFSSSITIGAVTIADGADIAEGARADAAIIDPAASASVIALLKGLLKETIPAPTATISSVTANVASVTLAAANLNRRDLIIVNDSASATLYVKYGAAASPTSYTYRLDPFAQITISNSYSGLVAGIWTAAVGNARVTETA